MNEELNKLGKIINSINISNINKNNLNILENVYLDLNSFVKSQKNTLTNRNKALSTVTYQEIRQKFLDLSYLIYLKSYNSQTAEKFKKLFDLQKKLLEMFNKYFDNPQKIENYLNYMKIILFLIFPEQTSLKKSELNIDNSFNIFGFTENNEGGINYFLYILKTELENLKKKEDNLKILKEKSAVLIKLCEIFFKFNLQFLEDYSKLLKECIKKFLENIYNIAKNMKNIDFLKYLEIYNNVLSVYGTYFGYPNSNSSNKKNNVIWENLKELFDIFKTLNLSENQNHTSKRENIKKEVILTIGKLLEKVKNRVNQKVKQQHNNLSINNQNNINRLKKLKKIFKLYDNSFDQNYRNKLYASFKQIKNSILANIANIKNMEHQINRSQAEVYVY
jgi:hypothetical protein